MDNSEVGRLADAIEDGTCVCLFDIDSADAGSVMPVEIDGQRISEDLARCIKAEIERRLRAEEISYEPDDLKEF